MRRLARGTAVEPHAEGFQPVHGDGSGRRQHRDGVRVAQARARCQRVERMQTWRVLGERRRRDAALRAVGGSVLG